MWDLSFWRECRRLHKMYKKPLWFPPAGKSCVATPGMATKNFWEVFGNRALGRVHDYVCIQCGMVRETWLGGSLLKCRWNWRVQRIHRFRISQNQIDAFQGTLYWHEGGDQLLYHGQRRARSGKITITKRKSKMRIKIILDIGIEER